MTTYPRPGIVASEEDHRAAWVDQLVYAVSFWRQNDDGTYSRVPPEQVRRSSAVDDCECTHVVSGDNRPIGRAHNPACPVHR